jgi:lysine 6-dehydrogenase
MKKVYAVLGAGMQGTAAAYDLAKFANPAVVKVGDVARCQAERCASRVNELACGAVCEPHEVSALDPCQLASFLEGVDAVLSCVPYWMHPSVARVAIDVGASMCDLGGNTQVTWETLALHEQAVAKGVTLVPDTGLAPGLVNSLGLWLIENVPECHTVRLYCGVLPQNPKPPFNYKLTFNVEGLVTEYDHQAAMLQGGEIKMVDTLSDIEVLEFDGFGPMEAFNTSGGTSTAPYTLKGRVANYVYKTVRFPGHCERMRIFKDFGFWSAEPVEVDGVMVAPRSVFYRVFGAALARFEDLDQCLVRAVGEGAGGVRRQIDIFDRQCPATGFTSMERLTGFSMAIFAREIAEGRVPSGAIRYEQALTGARFVEELQRRGVRLTFR